jgi:putative membrane protein
VLYDALKGKMNSDKEINDASRIQQYLANQRTFLAWLRTSVALIGLGFVVSRFGLFLRTITVGHSLSVTTVDQSSAHYSLSSLVGTAMVVLGIVFTGIALKNYLDTHKYIMKGSYLPKHVYIYLISISLIVLGAIIVAYLLYVPLSIR